jgi:HTH-type transcriptional regulator / antitoxin HigA
MEDQMNVRHYDPATDIGGIVAAWSELWNRTKIGVIRTRRQYDSMIKLMDHLVDEVGDDEHHRLAGLLGIVGTLIQQYEEDKIKLPKASPSDVLRYLMDQHGLRQTDLKAEVGSQGVVSEVLNGKREINARQAKALAVRFNISPAVFL